MYKPFVTPQQSHAHSLQTLNLLYEYDDFMESVGSVVDMGCGHHGLDLEWWATRTVRDDTQEPLNIKCTGVDRCESVPVAKQYKNVVFLNRDCETFADDKQYDVLWCHDVFQYMTHPLGTLHNWWHKISPGGMIVLIFPQTTNIEYHVQAYDQWSGCYHNHTVVSIIHQLAVSGFDCASGFFKKLPDDPWIYAIAYKSSHTPMKPANTAWHDLAEKNLLPDSAVKSLDRYGHVRQRDLVLPWLDKSLTWLGSH